MLTQQQLDTTKTIMDVLHIFPVFSVKDTFFSVQSRTEIVIGIIMDYVQ